MRTRASSRRALLWWGLWLLWCVMIYYVSADPGFTAESTGQVFQQAVPEPVTGRPGLVETVNLVVRKTGHAVGFGFLGAFSWAALRAWPGPRWMGLWAWLLATLYAVSDERHQSWVPGRTGVMRDVLLDSAGAALGVLVAAWIAARLGGRRQSG